MTKKELIDALAEYKDDAIVVIGVRRDWCNIEDIETYEGDNTIYINEEEYPTFWDS